MPLSELKGRSFRQSGDICVTVKLGRAFCLPETTCHEGVSHGLLDALDSISPLVVTGLPADVHGPERIRTVDVVPICLQSLRLASDGMPGKSHVSEGAYHRAFIVAR
ncbi:hypothetical protein [Adhaeretor mobilis]|uniref:Uncharacterized protein n=1 Tax=Adhaeretor mobilis TaxID=1930276 RepID=A0A517MX86_9BACT|nr:hypothetical protein [Adhaeretor mobilis]QDS99483.1 hypothetical protein HG15A2_28060 [Adhaeretor mobilis]